MKTILHLLLTVSVLLGVACSDAPNGSSDGEDTDSSTGPVGDSSEGNGFSDTNDPDTGRSNGTSDSSDTTNRGDTVVTVDTASTGDTAVADDTTGTEDTTVVSDTSDTAQTGDTADSSDTTTHTNVIGDTGDTADTATGVGDTNTAADSEWDTIDTTGEIGCMPVPCGKTGPWACGDCLDNDSDGRFDAADPDCLGPCDNNESGFVINIDGSAPGNCGMDCYFDDNNGNGDDECLWDFRCDSDDQHYKAGNDGAVCTYEPQKVNKGCDTLLAAQPAVCNAVCEPLVPNGCDCWGCCLLEDSYRFIGTPGCALDNLESCDPCTPVPSCNNPCGECELCIGETTLEPECLTQIDTDVTVDTDSTDDPSDTDTADDPSDTDSTDDPSDTSGTTDTEDDPVFLRCADGRQPCGQPGDAACAAGYYCITGCCTRVVLE